MDLERNEGGGKRKSKKGEVVRVRGGRAGARGEANTALVVGIECLVGFPLVQADPLPFLAQVLCQSSQVIFRCNGSLVLQPPLELSCLVSA
eukprot:2345014-Rhodomonas_salina.2